MEFTEALGLVSNADTTLQQAEHIDMWFEADGAIPVGSVVALDTGNTAGKLVVVCPAAATADHRALGIYQGQGGSGAETTTSGLLGRAAVDGDIIKVRVFGVATALFDATTTQAADGDVIVCSTVTAGQLFAPTTTFTAGAFPLFTVLEALATTSTITAKKVFVRGV